MDREGSCLVPHLLVFDVIECDQGDNTNVATRGERLRGLARCLPQPMCVLQWAGEPTALEGFVRGLPHPVECIMSLSEDPFKVYRHMKVDVPPNPMAKAGGIQKL
jgi:hypothetical protein